MDYNRVAANVVKKIAQYGRDVTLRQYPQGGTNYDPTSLTVSQASLIPNETVVKALETDQPGKRIGPQYGTSTKQNTLIVGAQKWLYVGANCPKPRPTDKFIIGYDEYNIADVQQCSPGGIVLYYLVVVYK